MLTALAALFLFAPAFAEVVVIQTAEDEGYVNEWSFDMSTNQVTVQGVSLPFDIIDEENTLCINGESRICLTFDNPNFADEAGTTSRFTGSDGSSGTATTLSVSGAAADDGDDDGLGAPEGYFRLTTMFRESQGECLEGNQAASGPAFMDTCQDVSGQLWKLIPTEHIGYFKLTTMFRENEGECLEGNQINGSAMNGAAFMAPCQDVSGQLWKMDAHDADGTYFRMTTMFRENEGECLEGNQRNGSAKNGAAFMDKCQDVSGQIWTSID